MMIYYSTSALYRYQYTATAFPHLRLNIALPSLFRCLEGIAGRQSVGIERTMSRSDIFVDSHELLLRDPLFPPGAVEAGFLFPKEISLMFPV